jgi:hypothetical protein
MLPEHVMNSRLLHLVLQQSASQTPQAFGYKPPHSSGVLVMAALVPAPGLPWFPVIAQVIYHLGTQLQRVPSAAHWPLLDLPHVHWEGAAQARWLQICLCHFCSRLAQVFPQLLHHSRPLLQRQIQQTWSLHSPWAGCSDKCSRLPKLVGRCQGVGGLPTDLHQRPLFEVNVKGCIILWEGHHFQ